MKKIGVLIIHGVGSQEADYSAEMVSELRDRLGSAESRLAWEEILWAPLLKPREDILWQCMKQAQDASGKPLELDWMGVRKFLVHNVGDAFAYHRDYREKKTAYSLIHNKVSSSIATLNSKLADPAAPIVVMAHSLGAHIMSDYIWDRQKALPGDLLTPIPDLVAIITFGANIPLFSLTYDVAKPIRLPGKGIKKTELIKTSRWLNFFDRDDVLGWPIKVLYAKNLSKLNKAQKDTVSRIDDREINVGSLIVNWNPAAHEEYWTDDDFTKPVESYLKRLVAAVDS